MDDGLRDFAALRSEDAAQILRQVLLARAAELARGGSLDAAIELLRPTMEAGSADPGALDLMARIRAQQGILVEAERLWTRALQSSPSHAGAIGGLARLRRDRRRPAWVGAATAVAAACLVAAGIVIAGSRINSLAHQVRQLDGDLTRLAQAASLQRDAEARATLARIDNFQASYGHTVKTAEARFDAFEASLAALDAKFASEWRNTINRQLKLIGSQQSTDTKMLHGQLDALAASQSDLAAAQRDVAVKLARFDPSPPLRLAFPVEGVVAQDDGSSQLLLWLRDPLFDPSGAWQADAEKRLRTLARALVQMQARIRVDVIALQPHESTSGGAALTTAEIAERAATLLVDTGLFPSGVVQSAEKTGLNINLVKFDKKEAAPALVLRITRAERAGSG